MIFADRDEAGRALADELAFRMPASGRPGRILVLALPRGGVPVAVPVAGRLDADLDLVLARKIGAPGQPEFGVGAIAEDGPPVFDGTALRYFDLTEDDLADTVAAERAELDRRLRRYRADRPAPSVTGRTVVLVDDGLATGVTAHAALRWLAGHHPGQVIVAVPVCSRRACDLMAGDADSVVCLHAPEDFTAVGRWYADFTQLSDADVDAALEQHRGAELRSRKDAGRGVAAR
ncbi:phosphoribosyltransferase [Krasilnikovia sp. MM14-A1004]|uniref:phosphoribosyltransferase n=1 Tax=Krasilnikovia sp. MM14-A1004 TaxID=3373541 RepID=UPI00399C80F4